MSKLSDNDLYERIRERDREALELLYDRYERLLYSFAYRMTKDQQIAEEIMQDVFMKIWQGKGSAVYQKDKGSLSSWLLTITRNASIDVIRRRKPEVEWDPRDSKEETTGVEEQVELKESNEELEQAIALLSEEQQKIVRLFYFQGLSQRKIAESCDIPLGTVKGRIRLALKKLKEHLSRERRVDYGE